MATPRLLSIPPTVSLTRRLPLTQTPSRGPGAA